MKSLSIFLVISISCLASAMAEKFEITNKCPYTVWAASVPHGGGKQLISGQTWTADVPAGTTGARVWARTNCNFDGSGQGHCETGDCGGVLQCTTYGTPPNTLAEFTLSQVTNLEFFDISLVDGFNVPMELIPTSDGCATAIRCTADINGQCPSELQISTGGHSTWMVLDPSVVIGCNNPCTVFKTDRYCCNSGSCNATDYSRFFKTRCPYAYSYPLDDKTSTFTCPVGAKYRVVFCP